MTETQEKYSNNVLSYLSIYLDNTFQKSRIQWDELFITTTKMLSYRSSCSKTRQGALLVKENRILSIGYNGSAPGKINCIYEGGQEACGKDVTGSCYFGIHAEQNCIGFAARNGINTENCTIYCTMTPCISCSKLIVACGIKEFVYIEEYRISEGLDFLKQHNINVRKYEGQIRTNF